jgi:hypothetical protein
MAISNLIANDNRRIANDNRQYIAQMFGAKMANDNDLVKQSDLLSNSFVMGVTQSLLKLNSELARMQENSKALIKSLDSVITSIRKLDKDMISRFKSLNSEISASRPNLSKMLFAPPPVPLAEMAPGIAAKGAVPAAGVAALPDANKDKDKDKDQNSILDEVLSVLGLGKKAKPKPPAPKPMPPEAPGAKGGGVSEKVPSPSPAEPAKTAAEKVETSAKPKPAGEPVKVSGETAKAKAEKFFNNLPPALGKIMGALGIGLTAFLTYKEVQEVLDHHTKELEEAKGDENRIKEADKNLKKGLIQATGGFIGSMGVGAAGAAIGSVIPGGGTFLAGTAGAIIGGDLGNMVGQALGSSMYDNKDFSTELLGLMKKKYEAKPEDASDRASALQSVGSKLGGRRGTPTVTTSPAPPAAAAETKEEGGDTGKPAAAPPGAGGTAVPSVPSAPLPPPRPNESSNKTTIVPTQRQSSTTTSGSDSSGMTNPNLKMSAHNTEIFDVLKNQQLNYS